MKKDWKTTAVGICLIVSALAGAAALWLDGDPNTNPDLGTVMTTILAGLTALGFHLAADSKNTKMLILLPLLSFSFLGCTTTSNEFKETLTEFDSAGKITTQTDTYGLSKASVAVMLKADKLGQDWSYTWGGNENKIAFGQNAQGYDATQQAQMVQVMTNAITPILEQIATKVVDAAIAKLEKPTPLSVKEETATPLSSLNLSNPYAKS